MIKYYPVILLVLVCCAFVGVTFGKRGSLLLVRFGRRYLSNTLPV